MALPSDHVPSDRISSNPHEQGGWWLRILTPEESEKLLREEPRIPIDEFLSKLDRKYGE